MEIGEARKEIGGGFDACPEFCVSWIVRIDCVSERSLDATDIDGKQVSLDQYKRRALLIVRWWGIPGTTILAIRGIRSWYRHNPNVEINRVASPISMIFEPLKLIEKLAAL